MKKKKSFWSMIARYAIALLFISSWAVLGVAIAINTAKVDIGGKVTFQATDVYADITGDITGTKTLLASKSPLLSHEKSRNFGKKSTLNYSRKRILRGTLYPRLYKALPT